MARDGSGTYSLPQAAFVSGTTIESAKVNSNFSDMASALTASLAKDGQTTPTANLPMGNFKHTGVADGSSRTDYASLGQVAKGTLFYAADTGAADVYVVAPSPGIAANVVGFSVVWKVTNANLTTTPTLACNSLTAGTIVWPNGTALAAGDLPAGALVTTKIVSLSGSTPTWHLMTVTKPPQARFTIGANGTTAMARSAETGGIKFVASLNSSIYGLTYANGTDATNDIDVAAGGCMDATGAYWITLAAITKQLDASWAVGTNQGGLDTGSIGNSDYYIWAIARSDTGVTDALFSLSSTAPTMPTNYDFKRLIGWFKRVGGTIVAFSTYETAGGGMGLRWTAPTLDVNLANTLTNTRRTDALKVPLNFAVMANFTASAYDASTGSTARICCPDETDAAPAYNTAAMSNITWSTTLVGLREFRMRTSATGTIAARVEAALAVDFYGISTIGFEWSRR